jgi:predicted TIM-barrel enzyme
MGSKAIVSSNDVLMWRRFGKDQHVAVSNTALAITKPAGAQFVQLNVQGADVRVTEDGDDPVGGSVGQLWKQDSMVYWLADKLDDAKFIRDGGTDAVVHVQGYNI